MSVDFGRLQANVAQNPQVTVQSVAVQSCDFSVRYCACAACVCSCLLRARISRYTRSVPCVACVSYRFHWRHSATTQRNAAHASPWLQQLSRAGGHYLLLRAWCKSVRALCTNLIIQPVNVAFHCSRSGPASRWSSHSVARQFCRIVLCRMSAVVVATWSRPRDSNLIIPALYRQQNHQGPDIDSAARVESFYHLSLVPTTAIRATVT